ncbi:DUF257 family protein [Thermococcus gorgonarius]|uniref:KaiC-like domain-containing protein n=1 Tax=Thermococcus gorgonarius TaxID=71997 RepID=A0A2Z2M4D9_THEGO|nr:DUF257 family protein [Thermococcus gorgonarius]ASJ00086.1 hypothetical protein A3K92_00585 [Thermococcus gorgonarius]
MSLSDLFNLLDGMKFGSTVIVENRAPLGAEAFLAVLLRYIREREIPVLVDDILDAFPLYVKHLNLMGINPNLSSVRVLKMGGNETAGNVVNRGRFDMDPNVYMNHYEKLFSSVAPEEEFINIVLGIDRLFVFQDNPLGIGTTLRAMKPIVTNRKRTAFYILESAIMENLRTRPLPALEDLATSVFELKQKGRMLIVSIIKDPSALRTNVNAIKVDLREVFSE